MFVLLNLYLRITPWEQFMLTYYIAYIVNVKLISDVPLVALQEKRKGKQFSKSMK